MWQEFKDYTNLDRQKLIKLLAYPVYQFNELIGHIGGKLVGETNSRLFLPRMFFASPLLLASNLLDKLENFILSFGEKED